MSDIKWILKTFMSLITIIIMLNSFSCIAWAASDNWGHFRNGLKFMKVKNYSAAEDNFSYYLKHPEMHRRMFGVAYFGLGLLYQDLEQYGKAINYYNLAIKNDLHPKTSVKEKSYINLGSIYMKRKSYKEAIHVYQKALKINDESGFSHYYLGLAYYHVERYREAIEEADRAENLGVEFTALKDKLKKKGVVSKPAVENNDTAEK